MREWGTTQAAAKVRNNRASDRGLMSEACAAEIGLISVNSESGIDFVGAPLILLLSTGTRLLTREEAVRGLGEMIEEGWRCGPGLCEAWV